MIVQARVCSLKSAGSGSPGSVGAGAGKCNGTNGVKHVSSEECHQHFQMFEVRGGGSLAYRDHSGRL